MIQTTSPEIGQELEKALISAGYETGICNHRHISQIGVTCTRLEFKHIFKREYNTNKYFDEFPAVFTMGELWDMLPKEITYMQMKHVLFICSTPHYTFVDYAFGGWDGLNVIDNGINIKEKNPCNALAKLVIWCIENGHKLNLPKT